MSRHHTHLHARRWAAARRQVHARDLYRCRSCGRAGRLECDHVIPLERSGDPYDLGNLQALCRACHIAKTAQENRRALTDAEAAWRGLVTELLTERQSF